MQLSTKFIVIPNYSSMFQIDNTLTEKCKFMKLIRTKFQETSFFGLKSKGKVLVIRNQNIKGV